MISLDTETTGVDFRHGAKPFLTTICEEANPEEPLYWEWPVDPLTRKPKILPSDLREITGYVQAADLIVLQNAKFDVTALSTVQPDLGREWPWDKTHDTLLAGHLLASNQPHDLTSMILQYLGVDIEPVEKSLEIACKKARDIARRHHKDWRIAKKDDPTLPSAKDKSWKYDTWLPRALARKLNYPADHPWHTVLSEYAIRDSVGTLALYKTQRRELHRRGLWEIYLERLKILPIAYRMEEYGVTLSSERLSQLITEYKRDSKRAEAICKNIAASKGYELIVPRNGNNKSLREFVFSAGGLNLPAVKRSSKTGEPSLDKSVLEQYEATLPEKSKALLFVKALKGKRKRDTAVSYMEGYERYWIPLGIFNESGEQLWYRLHPSLNPTGTDTLRWSSNNPNEQNISKQPGFNLRYTFGPAPGREWWSLDAKNIELRLPAYEAGEDEMIALFERPDDPPYYGSNHLLVCHILHPEKFEECIRDGVSFKDRYKGTWYQWTKNGNFAVQYGAVESSGTADRAYHVAGAQHRIQSRFSKIKKLNDWCIRFANKHGYIETIPDKTVNPKHGYPLLCTRSESGQILPTVPLNYRIQGSAMWWTQKAMIRCEAKLLEWRAQGFDGWLVMQVHDELVFDFPKVGDPVVEAARLGRNGDGVSLKPSLRTSNLWRIREIQKLMEQGGDDIGIPTPVNVEFHPNNWSEGVTL